MFRGSPDAVLDVFVPEDRRASSSVSAVAIGKLQSLTGSVTITRGGTVVTAPASGNFVYEGDLIETGPDGHADIIFADGTAFCLYADARIALDQSALGAGKISNSALLRVAKGVFAFIGGKLASNGGLIIDTPAGQIRSTGSAAGLGSVALGILTLSFIQELKAEGAHLTLLDDGAINYKDLKYGIFEIAVGHPPRVYTCCDPSVSLLIRFGSSEADEVTNTPAQMAQFQAAYQNALSTYLQGQQDPLIEQLEHHAFLQTTGGGGGSSTPPDFLIDESFTGGSGPGFPFTPPTGGNTNGSAPSLSGFTPPEPPVVIPPPPPPPPSGSTFFIWNSQTASGNWLAEPNFWNTGVPPTDPVDIVEVQSGIVNSNTDISIFELLVETGTSLNIIAGLFNVGTVFDYGTVIVSGDPPVLTITGPATITGEMLATGTGSAIAFQADTVANYGILGSTDGGSVTFVGAIVTNEGDGKLKSVGDGSTVEFSGGEFLNAGLAFSKHGGELEFDGTTIENQDFGIIGATDHGVVLFDLATVTNDDGGLIGAKNHGIVKFDHSTVTNDDGATIEAKDHGKVIFSHSTVGNDGLIGAKDHGIVKFDRSTVTNDDGATIGAKDHGKVVFSHSKVDNDGLIGAKGWGSEVKFFHSAVNNSATIDALWGGTVLFDHSFVGNADDGTIKSDGFGSQIEFDHDKIDNSGFIAAEHGGAMSFDHSKITTEQGGTTGAAYGGHVTVDHSFILTENGGTFGAEYGGHLKVSHSFIDNEEGATFGAKYGGSVFVEESFVENSGDMGATTGGSLTFKDSFIDNTAGSGSDGAVADVVDSGGNGGIGADDGGTVTFDHSFVINSGSIGADHGGTIKVDDSKIENSGGTISATGWHSAVDLDHAFIAGGDLDTSHGGLIQTVWGDSTFAGVTIDWGSDLRVNDHTSLTLTDGTTMFGGLLTIDKWGTLDIESSAGATLDGVWVNNWGNIDVDTVSIADSTTLILDGGATITGGSMTIGPFGELDIENDSSGIGLAFAGFGGFQPPSATLDDVAIDNNGVIAVDAPGSADTVTLLLEGGTTITGGRITVGSSGELDVERGFNGGGATLDDVWLTSSGSIDVDSEATTNLAILVLDDGSVIDGGNLTIGGFGELDIDKGSNLFGADFFDVNVENFGTVKVDDAIFAVSADSNFSGPGHVIITGGGVAHFSDTFEENVKFTGPGALDLNHSLTYHGTVGGFGIGDKFDLIDVTYSSSDTAGWVENPSDTGGLLTIYDGSHHAIETIKLDGQYQSANFLLSNDGGGTDVTYNAAPAITGTDPDAVSSTMNGKISGLVDGTISFNDPDLGDTHSASVTPLGDHYAGTFTIDQVTTESDGNGTVDWQFSFNNIAIGAGKTLTQSYDVNVADNHGATATQEISISIGGPGNDNFVFSPGIGADTIVNYNPAHDTIDLSSFHIPSSELASLVSYDSAHSEFIITLGHDSIALPNIDQSQMQHVLQSIYLQHSV
jgi:hypothetical protein